MLNLSQEILRGKQSGWVLYFLLGKVTYWLTLGSFSEVQVKNQPINSVLVLDDIFYSTLPPGQVVLKFEPPKTQVVQ